MSKMSLLANYKNDTFYQNTKMHKMKNDQNVKMHKIKNSLLPLRLKNTIPYRGRGTPHKPQNAFLPPPEGSENTKTRKVPFI